jgi:hypothetical protein
MEKLNCVKDINELFNLVHVNIKDNEKTTLLHMAVKASVYNNNDMKRKAAVIKCLMDAGANYYTRNSFRQIALYDAKRRFGYHKYIAATSQCLFEVKDNEFYVLDSDPMGEFGAFHFDPINQIVQRNEKKISELYISQFVNDQEGKLAKANRVVHEKLIKVFTDHKIETEKAPLTVKFNGEDIPGYYTFKIKRTISCLDAAKTVSSFQHGRERVDYLSVDKSKIGEEVAFELKEYPLIIVSGSIAKKIQKMKGVMILPAEGWCSY